MILPPPLSHRRSIPFYVQKSAADFRADPYERYDDQVTRQLTLHYGYPDDYPWQRLEDWVLQSTAKVAARSILEVGCGVGRLIGTIATRWPDTACYGFDYSYQMLKMADDYWRSSKELHWRHPGFADDFQVAARVPLTNIHLGLAAAHQLPFPDDSLDLVVNSFLLDRLPDPEAALKEWYRILRPAGVLLSASPLNFQRSAHWQQYYPLEKLLTTSQSIGFSALGKPETLLLRQPLDQAGNSLSWRTWVWGLRK